MSDVSQTTATGDGSGAFVPDVVILYCQRSIRADRTPAERPDGGDGAAARLKMVPCSSKVEGWFVLQILQGGVDAVELVCCPKGACQFLDGNNRAERRMKRTAALLESVGMSAERVALTRGSQLDEAGLLARARERAETVRPLGPSPMKKVNRT